MQICVGAMVNLGIIRVGEWSDEKVSIWFVLSHVMLKTRDVDVAESFGQTVCLRVISSRY